MLESQQTGRPPRIAVIGGGFCGALFAAQLARHARAPLAITVIEPRAELGGGVAYSTPDPAHRVNVPAARMTIFPDDPLHFDRWFREGGALAADPEALWRDGHAYPRRAAFGRYVAELMTEARRARPDVTIDHIRATASAARQDTGGGYTVSLEGGSLEGGGALEADIVVLATSHPPPDVPALFTDTLGGDPALIADPWQPDALDRIGRGDSVLIVGTGLTMADVVASLGRRGHAGRITAFSRHGLLPRGHAPSPAPFEWFAANAAPTRVRGLTRTLRALITEAALAGIPWQAVFDDLRTNAQTVWRGLDIGERRRFLRHLRRFWDVHRYRIAPQVEAELARRQSDGTLRVLAASARSVRRADNAIETVLRPRHAPPGKIERLSTAHIVITTGPAHGSVVKRSPVLASLRGQGLLRADPLGLGVAVDDLGQAIGHHGLGEPTLLVVGPLAREQYGELMGLPQVAAQPSAVAARIGTWLDGNAGPGQAKQGNESLSGPLCRRTNV